MEKNKHIQTAPEKKNEEVTPQNERRWTSLTCRGAARRHGRRTRLAVSSSTGGADGEGDGDDALLSD